MENFIQVPIHSVIDVITNSSTEIFTHASDKAVKNCHEAINEILKVAGSDSRSEDLFDVTIDIPEDFMWELVERIKDDEDEVYELFKDDLEKSTGNYEKRKVVTRKIFEYAKKENLLRNYIKDRDATFVKITAKNSERSNIDIFSLFRDSEYTSTEFC